MSERIEGPKRLVVAIGGNATHPENIRGTTAEQEQIAARAARTLRPVVESAPEVVITHGNGPVVGIRLVGDKDDVMIMTEKGIAIRLRCKDVSVISRNTQGVRLVRLEEGDKVGAIASVAEEEEVATK
jgi:carbamate kinase